MNRKVFFYVQHLLGIGHLQRAANIAKAISKKNIDISLISGGLKVPQINLDNVRTFHLPEIRSLDDSFKILVDVNNKPINEYIKNKRKKLLLEKFTSLNPGILIIEMFPFGRRQMSFELIPLLELARNQKSKIHIVCSVRDVLVKKKQTSRHEEMLDIANKYFDYILVHSDKNIITFDKTFPLTKELKSKLIYTGYVYNNSNDSKKKSQKEYPDIIVSAGGGAVGTKLLQTAIKARNISPLKHFKWMILVGINETKENIEKLKSLANNYFNGLTIEPARDDFFHLLKNSKISISQGGYNTLTDILATNTASIVIPYNGKYGSDQILRSKVFSKKNLIYVLDEKLLSPENLSIHIEKALLNKNKIKTSVDLRGAENTAKIIHQLITYNE